MGVSKSELLALQSATNKFARQGHNLAPAKSNNPNMRIYDHCTRCGISIYIWATNGQAECPQKESTHAESR